MKKLISTLLVIIILSIILVFGLNFYVVKSSSRFLDMELSKVLDALSLADDNPGTDSVLSGEHTELDPDLLENYQDYECILVLGCGVRPDGSPTPMLRDRLDRGIQLYNLGFASKILLSGDNGQEYYNEVGTMKDYCLDAGVLPVDLFLDHAGFSTYESMYRARDIFGASKVIVVTQKYHEYRAIYIGKKLGMDVYGVAAKDIDYSGQIYRDLREIAARDKDFVKSIVKPKPTYLGEPFDLTGDGRVTWD